MAQYQRKDKRKMKNKKAGQPSNPPSKPSSNLSPEVKQLLTAHIKLHRLSHKSILENITLLSQELLLLDQLWYKNHAQFRSAKWWKEIDSIRRCGKRIVGSKGKQSKSSKLRDLDPSNREKVRKDSLKEENPVRGWRDGQAWKSLGSSREVWISMWISDQKEVGKYGIDNVSLPKLHDKPSHHPTRNLLDELALSLKESLALLHELRLRSRHAFEILSAHLRTPPAPTFAPLCLLLLGICSRIEALAGEASWGARAASSLSDTISNQSQSQPLDSNSNPTPLKGKQSIPSSTLKAQEIEKGEESPSSVPKQKPSLSILLTKIVELTESLHQVIGSSFGSSSDPRIIALGTSPSSKVSRKRSRDDDDDKMSIDGSKDEKNKKVRMGTEEDMEGMAMRSPNGKVEQEKEAEELKKRSWKPRRKRRGPFSEKSIRSKNEIAQLLLDHTASALKSSQDFRELRDPCSTFSDSSSTSISTSNSTSNSSNAFVKSSTTSHTLNRHISKKSASFKSKEVGSSKAEASVDDKSSSKTSGSKARKRGGARERRREKRSLEIQKASSSSKQQSTPSSKKQLSSPHSKKPKQIKTKDKISVEGQVEGKVKKSKSQKRKLKSLLDDDDLGETLER